MSGLREKRSERNTERYCRDKLLVVGWLMGINSS